MYISKVQVDEGFLDGLEVDLESGLNVIIGARGTGKTSLIELIRYCLGVPGYTPEATKRSRDHALSILGPGQVTLTLVDGDRIITVSRTANDLEPQASAPYASPIVFSQTEIENVGLHAVGRLRLLDGFTVDRRRIDDAETVAISSVQSLSAEIEEMRKEVEELDQQLLELPKVEQQLAEFAPKEQQLSTISAAANEKKKSLDALSTRISASSVATDQAERLAASLNKWKQSVRSAVATAPSIDFLAKDSQSPLSKVRDMIRGTNELLRQALESLENAQKLAEDHSGKSTTTKLADEGLARALRKDIEALQAGAGSVVSIGQQLRERKAKLQSLSAFAKARRKSLEGLLSKRSAAQDRLDESRQQRFEGRLTAANKLEKLLGPRIKIGVRRAGQTEVYASAIADLLKGSGLRYNDLSQQIAGAVSPRELIEAAENNDAKSIAESAQIALDRTARVLGQVRTSNLGSMATVLVDDEVSLHLLDGQSYKNIGDLSTGQRCTVVLPIVMQHADRILIVDQPEDHIDNAFIVDTLIRAIVGRPPEGQLLVSTHNANIPVLGDASRVVQLGSDGRRGYVQASGALSDVEIVDAISSVMEGGMEAFRRRATFYDENSLL